MTLNISDLFTPATVAQWTNTILATASALGLPVTSWQSGGVGRTILSVVASQMAATDDVVSTMAQAGFLDSAAAVTPDPSTGGDPAGGWLDLLAASVYDVTRIPATFATGSVTITNTSASTYGPFAAGTYHVSNSATKSTFSNASVLTISAATTTTAVFNADVAGTTGTSSPGAINTPVTSLIGTTVSNAASLVGTAAESNTALVARCRLRLQALSPNGPSGAYQYFALTAYDLLRAEIPSVLLTGGPITRVSVSSSKTTGTVTTTIANVGGQVTGITNFPITAASTATPIVITANGHGLANGAVVTITDVTGNTAANGTWVISAVATNTFELTGSVGNGTYVGGGQIDGGDLGQVDRVLQANAVPSAITAVTTSAIAIPVTVVVNVWVPAAYASAVTGVVQAALATYFAQLPIGGVSVNAPNILPYNEFIGAVFTSASYIKQVTGTLNSSTSDIPLLSNQVATINGSPTINVFST